MRMISTISISRAFALAIATGVLAGCSPEVLSIGLTDDDGVVSLVAKDCGRQELRSIEIHDIGGDFIGGSGDDKLLWRVVPKMGTQVPVDQLALDPLDPSWTSSGQFPQSPASPKDDLDHFLLTVESSRAKLELRFDLDDLGAGFVYAEKRHDREKYCVSS